MIVKVINQSKHALPAYETNASAGMDVRANIDEPITLLPFGRALVKTGLFLEIPAGFECQVRPRSGLALKKGLTVLNSPGTIDADYRGEVGVILINLSDQPIKIEDGDSDLVKTHKKKLINLKKKLKGSVSPDINVLVKRDIEELEQKIQRVIALEKSKK
jgi:dUTP pyrophosphatase